jgi:hypothetical protein
MPGSLRGSPTNRGGYIWSKPPDFGADLDIERVSVTEINGKRRFLNSGETIRIQLKATCEANLLPTADGFRYDLEVKTYNDLV